MVEWSTKHNGNSAVVGEQRVFAVVHYYVVHRRKVMFANVKFAVVGRNDRKVMNSVSVPHRQRELSRLKNAQISNAAAFNTGGATPTLLDGPHPTSAAGQLFTSHKRLSMWHITYVPQHRDWVQTEIIVMCVKNSIKSERRF